MDEVRVSAADFQRDVEHYQQVARREPVAILRDGRESCVLISTEEYRRLKRRDREVLSIEDFTDADAQAVRQAQPSNASHAFDHEVTSKA